MLVEIRIIGPDVIQKCGARCECIFEVGRIPLDVILNMTQTHLVLFVACDCFLLRTGQASDE